MTAENPSFVPDPMQQTQDVVESAFADYMRSPTGDPGAEALADATDIVLEVEAAKEIEQVYSPGEAIPEGSDPDAVINLLTKFTALHLQEMALRGELPEPIPSTEKQRAEAEANEQKLDDLVKYVADRVSGRVPIESQEEKEEGQ